MRIQEAIPAPNHSPGISPPRLSEAAHEFEAQMMKELLKPMIDGADIDGDDQGIGSCGAMGEFAAGALGQSISRSGGLGIATCILRNLAQEETSIQPTPNTGEILQSGRPKA